MKKINLNTSSSSILSATIGDVFELDGHTFILEGSGRVYLTLLNTEYSQWHKDREGRSDWSHVRNLAGYALMTRGGLLEIIESGSYFIE